MGLRQRVEDETEKLGEQVASLWDFKKVPWAKMPGAVWKSIVDDDIFGRAAQLAYYFFFSIFPGLIFISSMIGLVSRGGSATIDHLLDNLSRILPPDAFHMLETTFHSTVSSSGGGKLALGIIFALWSATYGMTAAEDTLNAVYQVRETRPLWKQYLIAILLTIATAVLACIGLGAVFYGDLLGRLLGLDAPFTVLLRIAMWILTFATLTLIFAMTYYFAPDVKQGRWQWITPGAVLGVACWILASIGLRVYLHFSNSYSVMYGSLGAVMLLLLWFYVSGLMLLVGASINSNIESMLTPARKKAAELGQLPQTAA
jgi:membrane protein